MLGSIRDSDRPLARQYDGGLPQPSAQDVWLSETKILSNFNNCSVSLNHVSDRSPTQLSQVPRWM
jgi:hypothetical protein